MNKLELLLLLIPCCLPSFAQQTTTVSRQFSGSQNQHIAFPIGGMGAGMFTLEGTGAVSHFSIRHNPDMFNEPPFFAAICIQGKENTARVLEAAVPTWKKFGQKDAALGGPGMTWGLARFSDARFSSRFPFGTVQLEDPLIPLAASIQGWSPFIPTDPDNSSLPVGALEYQFSNRSKQRRSYIFYYHADLPDGYKKIGAVTNGFELLQEGTTSKPEDEAHIAIFTDNPAAVIDRCGFRSGWFDPMTMAWHNVEKGIIKANDPQSDGTGGTIQVPFSLEPGQSKTIRVLFAWYVPYSHLRFTETAVDKKDSTVRDASLDLPSKYHKPWYSKQFDNIANVVSYWGSHYQELKKKTNVFTEAFYKSTLPSEITEAIAANLSILKSPTVLRQYDGRFWGWEGCGDSEGSCPGSCEHVWNYAQALCHLFPSMERSMRETEFNESQNAEGHQMFRAALPIRPQAHDFYAAADGQLGGIMKVYRDWRISGDNEWIKRLYPRIKQSLDYCILTWDPRHTGTLEEPHHNTYDIEFWGADPMCTGFYLGALEAIQAIGNFLGEDISSYEQLYQKGRQVMETKLFNGQYFFQQIQWTGLNAPDPVIASKNSYAAGYSEDALALLKTEGPKYQYGNGVLSDGMIGAWMARVCGLPVPFDHQKIASHLNAVYQYNFKKDLSGHSNPQRPTYALGKEGGLLLCSWPKHDKLSLPFTYSDEVWTGIEYEVASHLIMIGKIKEGLQIVSTVRKRYDGSVRNPYDEYECGHFYARAMSSYALIEACTGAMYDAVNQTLYINSKVGDFTSFISTDTGFGNIVFKKGKATVKVVYGKIAIQKILINQPQ